jgi:hypothetical protein
MEDVRLGRKTGYATRQVTLVLAGTVAALCEASEHRIALIISSSNNAPFNIAPFGLTPAATVGIRRGARYTIGADINTEHQDSFMLNIAEHGRLVTAAWNGASIGIADAIVNVTEVYLMEE